MRKEKRRARRRQIRYAAWVAAESGSLLGCALSDISDTGARIDIEDTDTIPDRFMLWLAGNGSARRACSVVWRQPKQIGVRFHGRLMGGDAVSLVPYREPEAVGDAHSTADESELT
jgi:hypothetical protein